MMTIMKSESHKNIISYFTLRFCYNDVLHKTGERMACAKDSILIGQHDYCEIRYPQSEIYEDVVFAEIKPNTSGEGWHLIPCSEYYEVSVNGSPVDFIHYLKDGDRIGFAHEKQELIFNQHKDNKFDLSEGYKQLNKSVYIWTIAVIAALMFAMVGILYFHEKDTESLSAEMLKDARSSVYRIDVCYFVKIQIVDGDTLALDTFDIDSQGMPAIVGTAFLTTDSLLITARHCIEPWLNMVDYKKIENHEKQDFIPAQWALDAETYNQIHDNDTTMQVISYCNISSGDSGNEYLCSFSSSDFIMRKDRDEIIEIGDYSQVYYWRSIERTFHRTSMMRDDIAYTRINQAGKIKLGNRVLLSKTLSVFNKRLEFIGFPTYSEIDIENTNNQLQRPIKVATDDSLSFEMLAHNGELSPGYSGGPVLVRNGDDWFAVGVISVTDKVKDTRVYSVPVTELECMEKKKGEIKDGK